ncbi:conserved protein of unknown function [Nitrosotalea devaniterrae]|uniref:Uncharacterized protein n=1 Tax=Nitrosotalea devaniterrae TaxID=1078905 RepID=A0A128A1W1_9ARCH|nr:conserved protein of unknown function [Candidatus Nitrosotalea devanaterra]
MKQTTINHEFVELIPDEIKEGILYISIPFATSTHRCACGCGEIVVLPIRPAEWELIWDGETVSIYPSVGNWSLPCQSHYFITKNNIIWMKKWSTSQIKAGRKRDILLREKYFEKFKNKNKTSE